MSTLMVENTNLVTHIKNGAHGANYGLFRKITPILGQGVSDESSDLRQGEPVRPKH